MQVTAHDLQNLINCSNFANRFEIDLSIARVAAPLGLIRPARSKSNGLFVISKGTGIFTLSFKFPVPGTSIGLSEIYFLSSEITDRSTFPYDFLDLVITNDAQPGVQNPILSWGLYIDG